MKSQIVDSFMSIFVPCTTIEFKFWCHFAINCNWMSWIFILKPADQFTQCELYLLEYGIPALCWHPLPPPKNIKKTRHDHFHFLLLNVEIGMGGFFATDFVYSLSFPYSLSLLHVDGRDCFCRICATETDVFTLVSCWLRQKVCPYILRFNLLMVFCFQTDRCPHHCHYHP